MPPDTNKAPLAPRLVVRGARLSLLALRLEESRGPGRAGPGQPRRIVEAAERGLSESGFGALPLRERKAVLELFWRESRARGANVGEWLAWAEKEWRPQIAETRICAAMLRHFDSRHPATSAICDWLAPRQERLWGRFGVFARRWRLAEGAPAAEKIAASLAEGGTDFLDQLDRNVHARRLLSGSGFVVAVIESYALLSERRTDNKAFMAAEALVDLLEPHGLEQAGGSARQRAAARRAMVRGLVRWAGRRGSKETINRALDVSFRLAGDPRENTAFWRDMPEAIVARVEKWLVERTLSDSFRIVAELKTDDDSVLRRRADFWRAYLPHIDRARMIGARKARAAAARIGVPCSSLDTYLSDHCGFLIELRGEKGALVVMELNNRAQALFWPLECAEAPRFAQKSFDGSALRAQCETMLSHLPPDSWPQKFAQLIDVTTGILAP